MRLGRIVVIASLGLFGCAGLARAQGDSPQSASTLGGQTAEEQSLEEISEFRIALPRDEGAPQSLTEVVNLFPTRKRRRFHGSVYEFHRNDNLDARNFFDPPGQPLPEFKRNQFGFNLGTSMFSDSLTLLGSYDGLRIIQGSTRVSRVPTPLEKSGDFSQSGVSLLDPLTGDPFEGNRIPDSRIDPAARRMLEVLPDPNLSDPDRNFVNSQPEIVEQDAFSIRADYRLSEGTKVFGDYSYSDFVGNEINDLPNFGEVEGRTTQRGSVSYSQTLSAKLSFTSSLRFRRRVRFERSVNSGREGLLESVGIEGVQVRSPADEGFPVFDLSGYADFGDRGSPDSSVNNFYSLDSAATYVIGSHTLQFGGELDIEHPLANRSGRLIRGEFEFSGSFTGDAFADFLLGFPNQAERASGNDRIDLETHRWEVFLRDRWRLNAKLDLTLGLRYDFFRPYTSRADNISTFLPLEFEPPVDGRFVIAGSPEAIAFGLEDAGERGLVNPDRNDFSPDLGLAYSPWGNQELVVRAFYSIRHEPPRDFRFIRYLGRNFPFYFQELAQSTSDFPQLRLSDPFRGETEADLTVHGLEPDLKNAYFQDWGLRLESEPFERWSFELAYSGTKGTSRLRQLAANVPLPGPGDIQPRRPNPELGPFEIQTSGGSSIRHALEVEVERRLADGFSLRSEYIFHRVIDDTPRRPQNPRNLAAERAVVAPPHVFSVNYIWDLPFGREAQGWLDALIGDWRLSGTTRLNSGEPFTVVDPSDPNNDGLFNDRPDLAASRNENFTPSVDEFFDTSRFAPAAGQFGTAGRNILFGPSRKVWDIAFSKRIRISDSDLLEFRLELFNAFNNVNFDRPDAEFGSALFGQISGAGRAREIEIALKYSF